MSSVAREFDGKKARQSRTQAFAKQHTSFIGTFISIMAVFSILRQTGIVDLEVEVPCLVVAFGVLLLIVTLCGYFLPNLVGEETGSQSPA